MTVQDELLSSIVNDQFGAPPAAAAAAAQAGQPPAAGQPGQPPAQPPGQPAPTTPMEKAAAVGDVTDPAGEEAISFIEIEGKSGKRKLTSQQIASALDRYAETNSRMGEMSPVLDLVDELMSAAEKAGHKGTYEDVGQFLRQSIKTFVGGAQSGNGDEKKADEKKAKSTDADDVSEKLRAWAEKNGLEEVPPGISDIVNQNRSLQAQMGQLMQMLQQVGAGQMQGQQVQQVAQQAAQDKVEAYKQRVGVNLQAALTAQGMGPDTVPEFFAFAAARGYTPEDMLNRKFAMQLAEDFKNNREAPDMRSKLQRFQTAMGRREAIAGATEGAPMAPGGAAPAGSKDPIFDAILANRMG